MPRGESIPRPPKPVAHSGLPPVSAARIGGEAEQRRGGDGLLDRTRRCGRHLLGGLRLRLCALGLRCSYIRRGSTRSRADACRHDVTRGPGHQPCRMRAMASRQRLHGSLQPRCWSRVLLLHRSLIRSTIGALRIRIAMAEARRGDGIAELADVVCTRRYWSCARSSRCAGSAGSAVPSRWRWWSTRATTPTRGDPAQDHRLHDLLQLGIAAALDDACALARRRRSRLGDLRITAFGRAATARDQAGRWSRRSTASRPRWWWQRVRWRAGADAGRRKIALVAAHAGVAGRHQRGGRSGAACAMRRPMRSRASTNQIWPRRRHAMHRSPRACATSRIGDPRTVAITGLAKPRTSLRPRCDRGGVRRSRLVRVAVEAELRALAGEHGDDAGRDAVAAALGRRYAEVPANPVAAQVVIAEGLRAAAERGPGRPERRRCACTVGRRRSSASCSALPIRLDPACLAGAALARAAAHPEDQRRWRRAAHGGLPDSPSGGLPLLADFVSAHAGDVAASAVGAAHRDGEPRGSAGCGRAGLTARWRRPGTMAKDGESQRRSSRRSRCRRSARQIRSYRAPRSMPSPPSTTRSRRVPTMVPRAARSMPR